MMCSQSRRFRLFGYTVFFALGAFCGPSASAQDAQPQSSAAAPTPAPAANEKMFGPWHAILSTDNQGQNVTELRLPATQPYTDDEGKQFTPDLVLICKHSKTVVYLDMQKPVGSPDDLAVPLQYGSKGAFPTKTEWNLSADRVKAVAPDPLDFVTKIKDKTSLDFQVTPYEMKTISVFFALDSIEQAFELMGERCYQ